MPFEDEAQVVDLVPWSPRWAQDFERVAQQLDGALGSLAVAIQHIGSTSVPELVAKDVIDVQVLVREVQEGGIEAAFARLEFRRRPEPWNQVDVIGEREFPKAVYAPPPGARAVNVHVRVDGSGSARYALLFRDFLCSDADARATWAGFKLCVAPAVGQLAPYGQIKGAALPLLMRCAEQWAAETAWVPSR
jgi:dephospho-CoA kinase